jgi:DNA repair ATPase RecN
MDEDDIKAVNEQLQQLGAETDKLIRANQAVEEAVTQYKQFGGSGPDDAHSEFDLRDTEQFGEIFSTVSADTKKLETDMKNLDEAYSKLIQDKDMSALTDFINKFETGKKDMQEFGEAYKNVFNEGELQEIEDATIQMEKFVSNLQQIKDDKNFSDDERSDAILDALSNDTKSHRGYISSNAQGIEAVGKKATNVLNTLGAQGEANYNRVVDASGDARKKILRDLDDVFNRFKDAKEVRAFVKTLSGAGEAVSSMLALSNLGDILNDEDLSG